MFLTRTFSVFSSLLCLWLLTSTAVAQCDTCQCSEEKIECVKICKLICETKIVERVCWKSQFEDICLPGPSKKCGEGCKEACNCKEGSDGSGKKVRYGIWQAQNCESETRTRKRLMKKIEKIEIPTYRWVVETRCKNCLENCIDSRQIPRQLFKPGCTKCQSNGCADCANTIPQLPAIVSLVDISVLRKGPNVNSRPPAIDRFSQRAEIAAPRNSIAVTKNEPKVKSGCGPDCICEAFCQPKKVAINTTFPNSPSVPNFEEAGNQDKPKLVRMEVRPTIEVDPSLVKNELKDDGIPMLKQAVSRQMNDSAISVALTNIKSSASAIAKQSTGNRIDPTKVTTRSANNPSQRLPHGYYDNRPKLVAQILLPEQSRVETKAKAVFSDQSSSRRTSSVAKRENQPTTQSTTRK